ncbi:MAG: delta 1-pyrroline-5-carboxylate reductase [Chrysothrix sp. TS-e1954]|nr:MAG: delta 1-pyrroline-5-carboxylate reductase [Chrysothrix sp. TS-e1954]
MGIAILSGILASVATNSKEDTAVSHQNGDPDCSKEIPSQLPTRFIACVRRPESAKRVKTALAGYEADVEVVQNDNLRAIQQASVVLLCCKPSTWRDVFRDLGGPVHDILKGKLLISILAGVSALDILEFLYPSCTGPKSQSDLPVDACKVVRAVPNTAASVRESMTVIANPDYPLEPEQAAMVTWIFNRIGRVVRLPPGLLDVSTALCGSGPAFMALVLEALADGGVAMGLPRAEAQLMAAQTMRGTTGMVLNGEHPAILRDKVSTPGGCTIGGLLVLEEGRARGAIARAVREATVVASQLGKGVQGVNGTRF